MGLLQNNAYVHELVQILSSFLQCHLALKTTIFLLLVFVLFYIEWTWLLWFYVYQIDRSTGCYNSSIYIDYKVRSRVVFSSNI